MEPMRARPGALLPPQLLARTRHFVARLGLGVSAPAHGLRMPHGLIEQVFVDRRAKNFVRQFERADHRVIQIDNVYTRHAAYLFALLTST